MTKNALPKEILKIRKTMAKKLLHLRRRTNDARGELVSVGVRGRSLFEKRRNRFNLVR
jgi:hypothetical protein